MAKEDVKSFKMDSDFKKLVNEKIANSGMEGAEWLKSLMSLEALYSIRETNPELEYDLKDLEKHMNIIFNLFIRMYQRGDTAVSESKKEAGRLIEASKIEVNNLKDQMAELTGENKKYAEELERMVLENKDLQVEMNRYAKSAETLEEMNRLLNDKIQTLQKEMESYGEMKIENEQLKIEMKKMKDTYQDDLRSLEESIYKQKEELTQIINNKEMQIRETKETLDRKEYEFKQITESLKRGHALSLKEAVLEERLIWQDKIQKIYEMNNAEKQVRTKELATENQDTDETT